MRHTLAAAALIAVLASPSAAAGREEPKRSNEDWLVAAVRVRDLDLGTQAGAAALRRRIRRAAGRMCVSERIGPDPWAAKAYRRCVAEALENAEADVERAISNR
jgi:UrcA family protein